MNIILIGMRGSGKTTVGKLLSQKIGYMFAESDGLIEASVRENIQKYVEKHGWPEFRELESKIISKIVKSDKTVISTGGGVVKRQKNIDNLKRNGILILLSAKVKTLYSRIGATRSRPLLTNAKSIKDDLNEVFKKRKSLYEKVADYIIDVNNKNIQQVVDEIIFYLKKEKHL